VATVRPFQGILYDPQRVDLSRVVAPPYDVIGPVDQRRYYRQDPHNVVRLIAGEVRPTDTPENNKYTRAAGFFQEWLANGILRRETTPGLYVYRHAFVDPNSGATRSRQGIMGVVELEPFGTGILPHERTHARAKADRLSLTRAVHANLSPVFALYEDPRAAIASLIAPATAGQPTMSITGEEGDQHTVWLVRGERLFQQLAEVFQASRLYIADGHHRYETALNFRNKMRLEHPDAPPDAAFNFVLMLLVDVNDPGLVILPTHRLLHDLEGFDGRALLRRLGERFQMSPQMDYPALFAAMQGAATFHRFGIALADVVVATVDIPRAPAPDPVSELEVSVLHREILEREFGLEEAMLEQERYVSYSRHFDTIVYELDRGLAQAAFLLRPPAVSDVVAVAQAGQVMPQKSTYFFPKPASGLVFNPLGADIRIEPV
jgi:uncharacterized protein (DUF1015 family)